MWSKTMVYSKTSTPDGRTEIAIGDERLIVDVDYTTLDEDDLMERYSRLQSFASRARSFQILKHKLVFACFIFLPLIALVAVPSIVSALGYTGSGESLFEQVIWYASLAVSAAGFLSACALSVIRSYYRYTVLSKLNKEISAAEKELRRRGIDPNTDL